MALLPLASGVQFCKIKLPDGYNSAEAPPTANNDTEPLAVSVTFEVNFIEIDDINGYMNVLLL